MSFQLRCRELRTALGLSCRGMSARLQLSNNLWSLYEAGKKEPGLSTLARLHEVGVSVDWLVSGDGPMLRQGSVLEPLRDAQRATFELEHISQAIASAFASERGQRLLAWDAVVKALEASPGGVTQAYLHQRLEDVMAKDMLNRALKGLQAEGIVASSRDGYHLIRGSLDYSGADALLHCLIAIRELIMNHVPSEANERRRQKLLRSEVTVKRGSGVSSAKEFIQQFLSWVDAHSEVPPPQLKDEISLILSVSVNGPFLE